MALSAKNNPAHIHLISTDTGNLKQVLERKGYFFLNNCGGKGKCLNCRVEYVSEPPARNDLEAGLLKPGTNVRMACQHEVNGNVTVALPSSQIWMRGKAMNDFRIPAHGEGYGVAVDLGTTIIGLYLVNLRDGKTVSQHSVLNPQSEFGGDVMTRLEAARNNKTLNRLTQLVHRAVEKGINNLTINLSLPKDIIKRVTIAGNTAMVHLWSGDPGAGLTKAPFQSHLEGAGWMTFPAGDIGLSSETDSRLCPVLSGFIGGDTAAAILAADLDKDNGIRLLMDFGTNGEIVLAVRGKLYATSTAAGPAFEGVGLHSGMAALPGAIEGFRPDGMPDVVGDGSPIGICGSGYIALMSMLLEKGVLLSSGLLENRIDGQRKWLIELSATDSNSQMRAKEWMLKSDEIVVSHKESDSIVDFNKESDKSVDYGKASDKSVRPTDIVCLTQEDVRKFQLAKGAMAAGVEMLCDEGGVSPEQIDELIITGSFGNRIDPRAAITVGLIPRLPLERICFVDNAAGRGALLCLAPGDHSYRAERLHNLVSVINLGESEEFQEKFVKNMVF